METVKRGAGRPAAAARKVKHDQRNPQPSRHTADVIGEQVRERALADGATPQQAYGRMTVPELKARLATLSGGKAPRGVSRMGKGDLMNAILAAEKTEATREAVHGPQETASAPAVVAATETNGDPKGSAKADRLQNELYQYGWAFSARNYDGDRVEAVLTRGSEVLTVVWHGGVFSYEETGHIVGDRHTKVRNVSAAIRLGQRPAEAAESDLGRVVANKRFKPRAPRGVPAQRAKALAGVDLETVTEDELFKLIGGTTIEWVNRVSNNTEVATVSGNGKWFRIDERPDGRVVQFAAGEIVKGQLVPTGFRAARLDQIVRVGGSTRRRAQPQEAVA